VAFVVCTAIGLNTNTASADYVVAEIMWRSTRKTRIPMAGFQKHHITEAHKDCRNASRPGLSHQRVRCLDGETLHFASACAFISRSTSA
jgi:hypothetical protein